MRKSIGLTCLMLFFPSTGLALDSGVGVKAGINSVELHFGTGLSKNINAGISVVGIVNEGEDALFSGCR